MTKKNRKQNRRERDTNEICANCSDASVSSNSTTGSTCGSPASSVSSLDCHTKNWFTIRKGRIEAASLSLAERHPGATTPGETAAEEPTPENPTPEEPTPEESTPELYTPATAHPSTSGVSHLMQILTATKPVPKESTQALYTNKCLQESKWKLVSTPSAIKAMLPQLLNLPTTPPSLYLDSEGIQLSRTGALTILTIYVRPTNQVFIIDILTLGAAAFTIFLHRTKQSLKSILESPDIPICWWDVRNDSAALAAQFSITLRGVVDVQLMEVACRPSRQPYYCNRDYLAGYATCVTSYANLTPTQNLDIFRIKAFGKRMFGNGDWDKLNHRPMSFEIQEYCAGDVVYMAVLYEKFFESCTEEQLEEALVYASERVEEANVDEEDGEGRDGMGIGNRDRPWTLSPWGLQALWKSPSPSPPPSPSSAPSVPSSESCGEGKDGEAQEQDELDKEQDETIEEGLDEEGEYEITGWALKLAEMRQCRKNITY